MAHVDERSSYTAHLAEARQVQWNFSSCRDAALEEYLEDLQRQEQADPTGIESTDLA